jgi:hypothetical protein
MAKSHYQFKKHQKELANSLSSEGLEQELFMKINDSEKTRKNLKTLDLISILNCLFIL